VILAGDVGGTKVNLALYEGSGTAVRKVVGRRYVSHSFSSFEDIVAQFLNEVSSDAASKAPVKISAAGFGVAGPVIDHKVKATNLPWIVDGASLRRQLATKRVVLLNDLEATGYSLALLGPAEISILNRGVAAPQATQALVAAGTGLGEAILFWDGDRYVVAGSEGGHADLSPRTEEEIELWRFLKRSNEFVSAELVLSGRGFLSVHEFLDASVRHPSFDAPGADPAPENTRLGLAGTCPVCVRTLDLWAAMYGAEAGNLALKVLARGGVWVAGGIAPKIRQKLEDGTFFRAFCEKEKFSAIMAQIPIHLVLNEEAPLLGAASQAACAASH